MFPEINYNKYQFNTTLISSGWSYDLDVVTSFVVMQIVSKSVQLISYTWSDSLLWLVLLCWILWPGFWVKHETVTWDSPLFSDLQSTGNTNPVSCQKWGSKSIQIALSSCFLLVLRLTPETVSVTKQQAFRQSMSVSGVAHLKLGSIETLSSTSQTVSLKSKAAT